MRYRGAGGCDALGKPVELLRRQPSPPLREIAAIQHKGLCTLDFVKQSGLNQGRQTRDGRGPEEVCRMKVNGKGCPNSGKELNTQQRIAAQFKKIVMDAYGIYSQQALPYF